MTATFYVGDAIEVMGKLPEKSVDLVLSSPPFLALRSYLPSDHPDKALEGGSQATPGEYVDWLLDVVEACTRVLAPHGSLCFELGDTYSGSGGAGGDYADGGFRDGQPTFKQRSGWHRSGNEATERYRNLGAVDTGSPNGGTGWPLAKSLSLIPETFRFAMVYGINPHTGRRTEPWRLRNVIRWVRPNPPVGALGDKFRPATSELMVFCKAKDRFFDLDAVREPHKHWDGTGQDPAQAKNARALTSYNAERGKVGLSSDSAASGKSNPAGAPPLDWWNIPVHRNSPIGDGSRCSLCLNDPSLCNDPTAPLDWWEIAPGGFKGAHYAVWPPELLIKPIKAMCPEKVCRVCGEPSRRIVENPNGGLGANQYHAEALNPRAIKTWDRPHVAERRDLGFSDCGHDDWRPGLVLDPFAGSGTTLAVATGHGRDAIGIDLDERNYDLALQRVGPFILERQEI